MLHSKQYLRDSPSQSSRKIPQPVTNGGASTAGCTFPPDLKGNKDPIPFLRLFVERVRDGLLHAQGKRIKKQLVEQYFRSIGKIFAFIGTDDPTTTA